MKRRFFAQTAATGAISLGLSPYSLFAHPADPAALVRSLNRIGWSLGLIKRSRARVAGDSFENVIAEKNHYFVDRGYSRPDDLVFFFGESEEFCFYPMVLDHKPSRTHDFVLPVFRLYEETEWSFVQTLNRYQAEAIIKATLSLRSHSAMDLQQWLLPVSKPASDTQAGTYKTQAGTFYVKTCIERGMATSYIKVKRHRDILLEETLIRSVALIG